MRLAAASLLALNLLWLPAAHCENAPMAVESQAAKEWKEIEGQEHWVARLEKQIAGETRQLADMRAAFAKKHKIDLRKIESGHYKYEEPPAPPVPKPAPAKTTEENPAEEEAAEEETSEEEQAEEEALSAVEE